MGDTYECLSPWAEVDPVALEGITPRVTDLRGKRVGLVNNDKLASRPILDAVEAELGARFDGVTFTRFSRNVSAEIAETPDKYEEWVKDVDTVVLAVGD